MKTVNPAVYSGSGYTQPIDGAAGSIVGASAYNFTLNYFNGDYNAISGATPDTVGSGVLGSEYRPLYNGNISSMGVSIGALGRKHSTWSMFARINRAPTFASEEKDK
jgi:hypothetical protein